jgi:hypothetical protein
VVDGHHESANVPAGTVLELDGKEFNGEKLMDVLWDGRKVMRFTDELRARAFPV